MRLLWSLVFVLSLKGAVSQTGRNLKSNPKTPIKKGPQPAGDTEPASVDLALPPLDNAVAFHFFNSSLHSDAQQRCSEDMKLYYLKNPLVTCNDGTAAGYYLREAKGSKRWLIFLQGGGFCFSKETCDWRNKTKHHLMSSSEWGQTRKGTGIASTLAEENPHWWNANIVFVPYCSSDFWSGTLSKSRQEDYAFMGSRIIMEVIKDLAPKGIKQSKVVMLAGTSAGGIGVLLNVDRVAKALEHMDADGVQVRGVVDSGWFLDLKPQNPSACVDFLSCSPIDAIKKGQRLWHGLLPDKCRLQFKKNEEWQCFMGYKLHSSLKAPIFVVQWLFDQEQLTLENIRLAVNSVTEKQWSDILNLGRETKNSLHDISAVFAPACISHILIENSNWLEFQVKGVSVARALQCWEKSLQENKAGKAPIRGCPFHLIDSYQWPQCNPTCPALHDITTGQEMSLMQMFQRTELDNERKPGPELKVDAGCLTGMLTSGG
ncbi:palmitoleoyl-protein carboxylesterase notum2-like [Ambystoma mexicanum]|uniref:palmitoleoyl-protein carboxylesterase notum2-like n=1 Tax=Ambystoma mexicanum TaxID=8296 RepID=UPI0037E94D46